jgi:hypothetical protein
MALAEDPKGPCCSTPSLFRTVPGGFIGGANPTPGHRHSKNLSRFQGLVLIKNPPGWVFIIRDQRLETPGSYNDQCFHAEA